MVQFSEIMQIDLLLMNMDKILLTINIFIIISGNDNSEMYP